MSSESVEEFADNWAYLKTELNWLERVLMMAIARQRKDTKEIDRVARTRADKATSHWWKGIIAAEGAIAHEDHRPPNPKPAKSYQQQLDARIQVSHQRGIVLALPLLCDRLGLTPFEKNLVLLGLAPEVNRRYGKLYRYLHGDESGWKTDLPSVDLALRIFCRNDAEWRAARLRLTTSSPLFTHRLLNFSRSPSETLLQCPIQLTDGLLHYLLTEKPTAEALDQVIPVHHSPLPPSCPDPLVTEQPSVAWADVILPTPTLDLLHHLAARVKTRSQVENLWQSQPPATQAGTLTLLAGAQGTGKTTAARAIATELALPLVIVDLATIDPATYPTLWQTLIDQSPAIVLIKTAEHWLKRSAFIDAVEFQRFLQQRQQRPGLTLLSVATLPAVALSWQRQMDFTVFFSSPNPGDRQRLWKQVFPATIALADDVDWNYLAQLRLTGGQIRAIAHSATVYLASEQQYTLTRQHLQQALHQHGYSLSPRPVPETPSPETPSSEILAPETLPAETLPAEMASSGTLSPETASSESPFSEDLSSKKSSSENLSLEKPSPEKIIPRRRKPRRRRSTRNSQSV
jgi:hypothetical protein